jgi:hypothetical protein
MSKRKLKIQVMVEYLIGSFDVFVYTVCLKDVLEREEHPTLNSKCPLLTPQRTLERARTPKGTKDKNSQSSNETKQEGQ